MAEIDKGPISAILKNVFIPHQFSYMFLRCFIENIYLALEIRRFILIISQNTLAQLVRDLLINKKTYFFRVIPVLAKQMPDLMANLKEKVGDHATLPAGR
jgi:hypothetical protein